MVSVDVKHHVYLLTYLPSVSKMKSANTQRSLGNLKTLNKLARVDESGRGWVRLHEGGLGWVRVDEAA